MKDQSLKIIVASDVYKRDGIGIEVYQNNDIILEIFRDDTKKTRTVTFFKNDLPLDVIEKSIEIFKKEIPWAFIEYEE